MTKAELVNSISNKLGVEKNDTQKVIEAFMQEIKNSLYNNDNVYLRVLVLSSSRKEQQKQEEISLRIQPFIFRPTTFRLLNPRKRLPIK